MISTPLDVEANLDKRKSLLNILYLRLAFSYQIKTKLFIVLLEEMIGQFC